MLIKRGSLKIADFFYLLYFVERNHNNNQKHKAMKFNLEMFITILAVLIVFKVLDKLFLESLTEKIGSYEEYEEYEEVY